MQLLLMERGHRPRPGTVETLEERAAFEERKSLRFDTPGMRTPEPDAAGQSRPFGAVSAPLIRVAGREADGDPASRVCALGIQALVDDALRGRFDLVLAEALDRLSRDQEDIAGLYKRLRFAGVPMVTLAEGDITELHVGLKGTMNALFLKDLADKTRRGLRGRVEDGKSGGGNSYGYDVVKQFASNGEAIRGDRTINETEAEVVRRIFRDYAAGKSAKRIAVELNRDGIAAPGGGAWGFSMIDGNPKRGNGILNNEMYVGRLVWNRQRFVKDPDTGKRVSRPNPESEWIVKDVPELRIVDDELWQAVKARQRAVKTAPAADGREVENHFRDRRRPKYLFSGLTRCGCCGGGYTMISADLVGCATARNKGICSNTSGGTGSRPAC